MTPGESLNKRPTRTLIFGLLAAGFVLYARALAFPALWDDHYYVEGQAFLRRPDALVMVLNPLHFFQLLPTANGARPAWILSVLLDRAILGGSFLAMRASSVLWHGAGAALLAALTWELTADAAAAAAAGFLFVAHPLHAEVVEIVAYRADALAFVLGIAALLLHLRAWRSKHPRRVRCAALAAFGLALLSKESAAAVPLLLPIVDSAAAAAPPWRARLRVYAAFALLLIAYLYYRAPRSGYESSAGADAFTALARREPALFAPVAHKGADWTSLSQGTDLGSGRRRDPRPWDHDFSAPQTRLRTLAAVQGSNLLRLFWPWPLQGDYAPKPVRAWRDPRLAATLAGWALLLAVAATARRRAPVLSMGLLWIPAALLPVSGIVVMRNLTADRYLYFASAGVCLCLAALAAAARGPRARRATLILCAAVAAVWIELGQMRLPDFRSDEAYYAATVAMDPDVPRARCNLGLAEWREGRLDAAEADLRAALTLWPQSRRVRDNLAALLQSRGRADETRELLNTAP